MRRGPSSAAGAHGSTNNSSTTGGRRTSSRKPSTPTQPTVPVPKRASSLSLNRQTPTSRNGTPSTGVNSTLRLPTNSIVDPTAISKPPSLMLTGRGSTTSGVSSVKSRLEEAIQSGVATPSTPPPENEIESIGDDDSSSVSSDATPSRRCRRQSPNKSPKSTSLQKTSSSSAAAQRRHPHELDASVRIEAIVGSGGCSPKKRASTTRQLRSEGTTAQGRVSSTVTTPLKGGGDTDHHQEGGGGLDADVVGLVSRSGSIRALESRDMNMGSPNQFHASPPMTPPPAKAPPRSNSIHGAITPSLSPLLSDVGPSVSSGGDESGSKRTLSSLAATAMREGRSILKPAEREAVYSIVNMCRQLPLFGCFQINAVCTSPPSSSERSYSFEWTPRNDVFARGMQYIDIMGYRTMAFDSVVRTVSEQLIGLEDALVRSVQSRHSADQITSPSSTSSSSSFLDEGLASRAGLAESCMVTRAATVLQLFAPDAAVPSLFHSIEELEASTGVLPGSDCAHSPLYLVPQGTPTLQHCSARSSIPQSILSPTTSSRHPPLPPKEIQYHYASTLPPPFHSHDLRPFMAADEGIKWLGEQEYVLASLLLSVAKVSTISNRSYLLDSIGLSTIDPASMTSIVDALNAAVSSNTLFGPLSGDAKSSPSLQLAEQLLLSHPIVHVAINVLKAFDHWGDSQAFAETWYTQVRLIFCSSCLRHNHTLRFRAGDGVLPAGALPIQGESVIPAVSRQPTPPGGATASFSSSATSIRQPSGLLTNPAALASFDAAFATLVAAPEAVALFLAAHIPNPSCTKSGSLATPDPSLNPTRLQLLNTVRRLQLAGSGSTRRTTFGSGPLLITDFDCGASSKNVMKVAEGGGSYHIWLEGDRGGDEKKVWFRYAMISSAGYVCDVPSSHSQGGTSSSPPPPPSFTSSRLLLTCLQCSIVPVRPGVAAATMPDITWGQRIPFKIKNIAPHSRLYKSGMRPSFKIGWTCAPLNGQVDGGSASTPVDGEASPSECCSPDIDGRGCEKSGGEYATTHATHRWTLTESAQYVQNEGELKEGELTFSISLPSTPSWTSLLHVNNMGDSTSTCDRCTHCHTPFTAVPPVKKGRPSGHGCPYCRLLRLLVSQQTLQHTVPSNSGGGVLVSTSPMLRPTMHVTFCDPYSYGDLLSHITLWHSMVKRATSGIRFEERVLCRSVDGRKLHLLIITSLSDRSSKQLLQESLEAGKKPSGPIGGGGLTTTAPMSAIAAASIAGQGFYNSVQSAPFVSFSGGKRVVLVSGRVHPSEVTASHAVHGIIQFLLSADPRAALLRDNFVFFIVPMINPDGVCRGHSRLDQHGFNLNRCYNDPSTETQPTVLALKNVYEHLQQQYRDQFIAYFDFHSHASQLYGFAFGNCLTGPNQSWNMFLTKLIEAQSSGLFDFGTCKFGKNQMTQKDGTSRVLFGGNSGLVHSYTVELSHYAHLIIKAAVEGGARGTSGSTDTHNLSHSNSMAIAMPLAPRDGSALGSQQTGPHVVAPYVGKWIPPTNAADHFLSNCCASHEDWYSAVREERHWMRQLSKKQIALASQVTGGVRKKASKGVPADTPASVDLAGAHLEAAALADEALAKPVFGPGLPVPQYTVLRQSAEVGRACILSLLDYCALDSACLAVIPPTSLVSTPGPGPSVAVVRAGGLDKLLREVKRENRPTVTGTKGLGGPSSSLGSKPSWNSFNRQF